jgi:hypothetical protein
MSAVTLCHDSRRLPERHRAGIGGQLRSRLAALLWVLETGIDCDSFHILVWLAERHGSGCSVSWPRCVIVHAALGSLPGAATSDTSGKF